MTVPGTFQISSIGKLEQLSTVEARLNIIDQKDIRPGHTSALPNGDGGITGSSLLDDHGQGRPKMLAPHLMRLQNIVGPDGQLSKSGGKVKSARGAPGVKLRPQDRIPLPDRRDEKGHNLKNRITRVRGSA